MNGEWDLIDRHSYDSQNIATKLAFAALRDQPTSLQICYGPWVEWPVLTGGNSLKGLDQNIR